MALRGSLRIRGSGGGWIKCGAALIISDAQHELKAHDGMIFIADLHRLRGSGECVGSSSS